MICAGVILGCIGTAAGLSMMTSKGQKPYNANNQLTVTQRDTNGAGIPENTPPPPAQEPPSEPLRVKPSTRIIFESFSQADNRSTVTDETPPYFLLDSSESTIRDYYPDWDIVEFNEERIKLYRTIPTKPDYRYVLGVKDNYLAVYQKSENGSVSLKEITGTAVGALPPDEQSKLISGIDVQTDAQLAQMLEDYGS